MNREQPERGSEEDLEMQLRSLRPSGRLDAVALWHTYQREVADASRPPVRWWRPLLTHATTAAVSVAATMLIMVGWLPPPRSDSAAARPGTPGQEAVAASEPDERRDDAGTLDASRVGGAITATTPGDRRLERPERWDINEWLDNAPPLQSPRGFEPAATSVTPPAGDALLRSPPTLGQLTRELQIHGWDVML